MKIRDLKKLKLTPGKVYALKRVTSGDQGRAIEREVITAKMIKEYQHIILFDVNGFNRCFTRWEVYKLLCGEMMM